MSLGAGRLASYSGIYNFVDGVLRIIYAEKFARIVDGGQRTRLRSRLIPPSSFCSTRENMHKATRAPRLRPSGCASRRLCAPSSELSQGTAPRSSGTMILSACETCHDHRKILCLRPFCGVIGVSIAGTATFSFSEATMLWATPGGTQTWSIKNATLSMSHGPPDRVFKFQVSRCRRLPSGGICLCKLQARVVVVPEM